MQAVTCVLPDCEVGIHGNRDLKAHCSARDNRRDESSVSGGAFEKRVDAARCSKNLYISDETRSWTKISIRQEAGGLHQTGSAI